MSVKRHLTVTAVLLVLLLGPCFGPVPAILGARLPLRPATAAVMAAFLTGLGLAAVWTFVWMRRNGRTLVDIGWRRPAGRPAVAVGALVGLFWGAMGALSFGHFHPEANLLEVSLLRAFTALAGAAGAAVEDMIVRGHLMNELQRLGVGGWKQAVLSAGLFAFYHSVWLNGVPAVVGGLVASLVYGLILAGLFIWAKRSLTPVVLAHSTALLVGEPFLTMSLIAPIPAP